MEALRTSSHFDHVPVLIFSTSDAVSVLSRHCDIAAIHEEEEEGATAILNSNRQGDGNVHLQRRAIVAEEE